MLSNKKNPRGVEAYLFHSICFLETDCALICWLGVGECFWITCLAGWFCLGLFVSLFCWWFWGFFCFFSLLTHLYLDLIIFSFSFLIFSCILLAAVWIGMSKWLDGPKLQAGVSTITETQRYFDIHLRNNIDNSDE